MIAVQAAPTLNSEALTPPTGRLVWIDYLRALTILLVVNMHACVTASHVGSWYFMAQPEPGMTTKLLFAVWQAMLQSFFMGLLFFLAGYFAEKSLSRRGPKAFLKERFLRLGVPALFFMLVIDPLIVMGIHPGYAPPADRLSAYRDFVFSGRFVGASGPLWFAVALLVFSAAYSAIPGIKFGKIEFTGARLLGVAAVLAALTFAVRIVQPMGTSILNMQLCFFPQYVVAFVLGIAVSQKDLLQRIASSRLAARVGWAALIAGPILLAALAVLGGPVPEHGENPFFGGLHWQALGFAVWEQFVGVGLACGAMAFAFSRFRMPSRLWDWLSKRSFAVYVLHAPILVAVGLLLEGLQPMPFLNAAVLTLAGLVCSFIAADLAMRIPVLKRIF